jgi:hypothetical protein
MLSSGKLMGSGHFSFLQKSAVSGNPMSNMNAMSSGIATPKVDPVKTLTPIQIFNNYSSNWNYNRVDKLEENFMSKMKKNVDEFKKVTGEESKDKIKK